MAKYILLSLVGNKPRTLESDQELRNAATEIGYYGEDLVEKILDGGTDWTEYVFNVDEAYPVPMNLSGKDIYEIIASWCVNVAFGKMNDLDTYSTLETIASDLDRYGNKGDEFRRAAEEDFWRGVAQGLDEESFIPNYSYMPDDINLENDEAVDAWVMAEEEYLFDEWYREQKMPFDVIPREEIERLVFDVIYKENTEGSWWK